jgi:hypothetical protein
MRRVIGIQSDGDGDPRDEDSKFNESREVEKLAVSNGYCLPPYTRRA